MRKHKHNFSSLWWHFGPYGRQDMHVHSCQAVDCDRVLIGTGRNCNEDSEHHREWLYEAIP